MEIRKYITGDEHKILALFKLAFNKEMSLEYWKWRFLTNPFGKDIMIHLMWDEDILVGHYAVSPIEMEINGRICKTALSMTTMTHPEYNGRGIFTQLSSSLYEELKNFHNYAMVWGFPNNNSHHAFIKNLKWKNVATIPMLSLKKSNLNLNINSFNYECHSAFNDTLAKQLNLSAKNLTINKTHAYLNWRYLKNPSATYKIISLKNNSGVIVYKVIPSFSNIEKIEIDIMEIEFYTNMDVLQQLLHAVIKNEASEINQFNMWNSIFSDEYLYLKKIGFISLMPLTYLGFLNLASGDKSSEQYDKWDINFGYSDVF